MTGSGGPPLSGFQHSVICAVGREFAWRFWTDVRNWTLDSDVESIQLEGPFAPGARGITVSRSSGPIEWCVATVEPGTGATIEIALPGAIVSFTWSFEDLGGSTRITQRVDINGEQAESYRDVMARELHTGIPAGMRKLCEAMAQRASSGH